MRFIIAPGNGGCGKNIKKCNWYGWFHKEMKRRGHESICVNWPDSFVCRQSIWLPFVRDELKADKQTVVVGHSTGALLAMRLLETVELHGVILVAAAHTGNHGLLRKLCAHNTKTATKQTAKHTNNEKM